MKPDEPLRYLYRVFCQPTALAAETRGWGAWRRLKFMVRMLPVMLLAQAVLVGVISLLIAPLVGGVDLVRWLQLAGEGLGIALAWGVIWNVTMGVAWGVVWPVVTWAAGPAAALAGAAAGEPTGRSTVSMLSMGLRLAAQKGAPLGFTFGVGLGLAMGVARGAWWGLGLGVIFGLIVGAEGRAAGMVEMFSRFLIGYSALFVLLVSFLIGYFRIEWYPIDVAATLWQRAAARRNPKQARYLLRRSPIYWHEPVWLPLPGLRRFLGMVGEDDYRAGLEECLFVISQRPTQGWVARGALMEIVTGHLRRVESVADIAKASEDLGRTRAEGVRMPRVLREALDGLQGLTREAEQHLTATIPHNRRRALERLRDDAGRLARELAMAGGTAAGMWAGVASRWQEVAEAKLAALGEAEGAAGYIHNPFVFGQPIEETETNLFVGRRGVVQEIEVSLLGSTQKPALVLWGPRRMGKTSVLLQLPRLLGGAFAPAFVDMQAMQVRESVGAFFRSLSEAAAVAMRRRGMAARPLAAADLEGGPFVAFAEWIKGVERELGSKRYLLLCLDEFERLETSIREGKLPIELMDQIRHLIQHHPQVVLLFAGSHRPDEMELNWPDALISTKMIQVSYLNEAEARQLITQPVPGFPVRYEEGSVERILAITRCQPYLVQALCFELVNLLNLTGRREVTVEEVEQAIETALESTHLYFAEMWGRFTDQQKALVEALAQGTGLDQASAEQDLRALERRSVVERAPDGRWKLQVPMVAEWVKRKKR
ncbi:MAG: hypothetical protein ACE149_18885 [Armatimonadota bacterium]